MSRVFLLVIRLYQLVVSPLLGPSCRFSPTCSEYTAICITRFGVVHGLWLGMKRILRCHPWGDSGYDPAPKKSDPTLEEIEETLVWTGKS